MTKEQIIADLQQDYDFLNSPSASIIDNAIARYIKHKIDLYNEDNTTTII